jgi:hypothetical protein
MLSKRQRNAIARQANRAGKLGIYDPQLPSPRSLDDDARKVYDKAYEEARKQYNDDETATATAWRTVRLGWRKQGKRTWQRCANGSCGWPTAMVLPQPGDLVGLGVLVEYAFVDKHGELQVRRFEGDEPTLYWDEKNKAMYAFPHAPYQACSLGAKPTSNALDTYERWHQRQSSCFDEIDIPAVTLQPMGPSDTVSYRSDKWHDKNIDPRVRGAQEYIHHHYTDVWTYQDTDDLKRAPNAIFVTGGHLDLHERGLIH